MIERGWLTHAGPYRVEHVPVPHPGQLDVWAYSRPKGVQHTTEGSALEGALSRFESEMVGSTFIVGRDQKKKSRILQLVPLGFAAAALKHTGDPATNGIAIAQVELVGFSQYHLWEPDREVEQMLAALYWQLQKSCTIPLKHTPNPHRNGAVWLATRGWVGHVDVPENDHVDPGAFDYERVFALARTYDVVAPLVKAKVKPKPRPKILAPSVVLLQRRARKTPPAPLCAGGLSAGRVV